MNKQIFVLVVTILFLVTAAYQGCGTATGHSGQNLQDVGTGSGTTYDGIRAIYVNYDQNNPCPDLSANGTPLANRVIFSFVLSSPQLVRDNCTDLTKPVSLTGADLQITANGYVYQNELFAQSSSGDFDIIAAECPSGSTAISNAKRINLISNSQNLLGGSWTVQPGIGISLAGSMAGLPRYQMIRNDPSQLDLWRGIQQNQITIPGATYAFTYFAQAGNIGIVWGGEFLINVFTLQIGADLIGQTSQILQNTGMQNVSTTLRPFSGGTIVTQYFTMPATVPSGSDFAIGVSPYAATLNASTGTLGDYIFLTAVQLENVSEFCSTP